MVRREGLHHSVVALKHGTAYWYEEKPTRLHHSVVALKREIRDIYAKAVCGLHHSVVALKPLKGVKVRRKYHESPSLRSGIETLDIARKKVKGSLSPSLRSGIETCFRSVYLTNAL